ncbi:MAG TPA: hypothetical protein VEQ61_03285, partial [Thermoleophilaceae bacterium]|nr:hypothetical protein [Thermoleophilaceae bacterium]
MRRCLTLAGALLLVGAQPAGAAVKITATSVEVSNRGARAVVTPSPFRLSFVDPRGRVVLRQVGALARSRRLPATLDPEPFGIERRPDNAVYAPLAFEVGRERRTQWNAGLWGGNLLFSRRSGRVHSAREVLNAVPEGRGVRLEVSTTDPRRRLFVRITPDRGRSLRVRVSPTSKRGVITMGDSFVAARGEGFHGFGGRHGTVNKRGEKLYGWTEQESLGGKPTISGGLGLLPQLVRDWSDYTIERLGGMAKVPDELPGGYERYLVTSGPNAAYYPQAQFLSSRGYGFMLNRPELSRWRMGNDRRGAWQVQSSSAELDYTVTLGPGKARALRDLTAIGGRHRLPPAWAQGSILSRAVRTPALPGLPAPETKETYRAAIEQDLADIERYGVKLSAYAFEGWGILFDDLDYVRDVIRRLHARGIKAVLYHRAYVSNDALSTQPRGDYEET